MFCNTMRYKFVCFGAMKHRGTRMHKAENNSKLPLDNSAHLRGLHLQSTEMEFNSTYTTKSNLGRRWDLIS